MARTFTRKEFYDLVWSKPMTHLAKEFILSDVALHKICRKHDVPNPPLGWWAKKAAGHTPRQTPLPRLKKGVADTIVIVSGEFREESELIAQAREAARIAASHVEAEALSPSHPIVQRTLDRLRRAKASELNGLVTIDGRGLISLSVAVASAERLETMLNQLAEVAAPMGAKLVATEQGAAFEYDGEIVNFNVAEGVRREPHVLTEKEEAEDTARRNRWTKRRSGNAWDEVIDGFSYLHRPKWDYHPTGALTFEFEDRYLRGGTPRRAFRDAKVQRLEKMAAEIAVGIVVIAAAIKNDRVVREEETRKERERKQERERVLRGKHIQERREKALDALLGEIADLERLRGLVASLRMQYSDASSDRVGQFVKFAAAQLAEKDASLSGGALEKRFTNERLFGEDDDHGFQLPRYL